MPNIAITNYCNLRCPYCFADDFIQEKKEEISVEQLERILQFLSQESNISRIGIIGGEPTLHSNFEEIIKIILNFSKTNDRIPVTLFTNGIKLDRCLKYIGPRFSALINLNEPHIIGLDNWNKIQLNLMRLKAQDKQQHISLGINLYPDIKETEYILQLAKKLGHDSIRCSYVAPTCNYNQIDKNKYYLEAKSIFLKFLKQCEKYCIKARLDCNHVPNCYFSDEELEYVNYWTISGKENCEPVVDITPDFRATACFGSYDPVDISNFNNLTELNNYLKLEKMAPLQEKNSSGNCSDCEKFQNKECQGGCLAFAKYGTIE